MNNTPLRRRHASIAALWILWSVPALAPAVTATANLTVSAQVVTACVVSGGTLNFGGSINPATASVPLDGTASITVQCSSTTPYTVALDAGANAGGAANFTARAIKNGSNTLGYQLYTDSGRSQVWGNGVSSSTVAGTGSGSNQTLTVYGRLPSLSGAVPGAYADTVTITITY